MAGPRCTKLLRHEVNKDNSCLFAAFALCCEEPQAAGADDWVVVRRLREVCAQDVLADPDPAMREVALGMPVKEYAEWIRNDAHWGGEGEVLCLAKHYDVEVAIASCESLTLLVYGANGEIRPRGRLYLLYTGQHYDVLLSDVAEDSMCRLLPPGEDPVLEKSALEQARIFNEEAARLAGQRTVKRIKCGGCGALLADPQDFQEHCSSVLHREDFAYDCQEVEVVVEAGSSVGEEHVDLADSERVYCFNNADQSDPLSMFYPTSLAVDGVLYPTLEHYWRTQAFINTAPEVVKAIMAAPTAEDARSIALSADIDLQHPHWNEGRQAVLLEGVRAKYHSSGAGAFGFRQALADTKSKTIANVDPDPWLGLQAQGGITSGRNHLGKALMHLRDEELKRPLRSAIVEGASQWSVWCGPAKPDECSLM